MTAERLPDGDYDIREIEMSPQKLASLSSVGRGRLLHPEPELAAMGHPVGETPGKNAADTIPADTKPLLKIDNLQVYYPIRTGIFRRVTDHVKAVDGVSFNVYRGQTLGLVGESGCGKTTTGRAIVRLADITSGQIEYDGADITSLHGSSLKEYRSNVQIIFQDPYSSLNPRMTVEGMLTEAMMIHGILGTKAERRERAASLLEEVGLETGHLRRYPHEFSGGQRQRISVARALAVKSEFIICDESVSALDVSVQAQVLNLLKDLQEQHNLTYIFISHDLSVVKFMSDMMAVMNNGKIVEFGPSEAIYENPKEEYTKRLISSIPNDSLELIHERVQKRQEIRKLRQT